MNTIELNILTDEAAGCSSDLQRMGTMDCDGILYTVEKPWLPNLMAPDEVGAGVPFKSCVPLGEYILVERDSPSKGMWWHFYNPDLGVFLDYEDCSEPWHRYSTMFHVANFVDDVVGCAGVGKRIHSFPRPGGRPKQIGVQSSAVGIAQFQQYMAQIMGYEKEARLVIQ